MITDSPEDNFAPRSTGFNNKFQQSVHNIIQAGSVSMFPTEDDNWPYRIGTIPPLAAAWQQRPFFHDLELAASNDDSRSRTLVLTGMGGAGKTQIAAAYSELLWQDREIDLLVWINAATKSSIIAAFTQAATEICRSTAASPYENADNFLSWLAKPTARKWLIVFDDLITPNDISNLWPPSNPDGRIIVTTRRRDAALDGWGRSRINIGVYQPDEAVAFLQKRLLGDPARLRGAAELASDLGFLPLGLSHAAAYILDQPGLTCEDYRRLVTDHAIKIADLAPEILPDGYPDAVAAAWSLSIENADNLKPNGASSALLRILSLLDPNGIPLELFYSRSVFEGLGVADSTDWVGEGTANTRLVGRILGGLHRLSLIDFNSEQVRVHSLVQRAIRDRMTPDGRLHAACTAANALLEIWPSPENNPPYSEMLRSNINHLLRHTEDALLPNGVHPVILRVGNSLGNQGLVIEAVDYFQKIGTRAIELLGTDHPDSLKAVQDGAVWRIESGDDTGALDSLREVLTVRERVFGKLDPETLETRHLLAHAYGKAGNPGRAVAELGRVVNSRRKVLESNHPDTLSSRHALAFWQGKAGDAVGAAESTDQLLADCLAVLGPDHPDTLTTRNNLAYWRAHAGDPKAAFAALKGVLEDRLRVLGKDHPDTLRTRHHLARFQGKAGDPVGASTAFEALVADSKRVLGEDHPQTLTARHALAYWRGEAGDPAAAVRDLVTVLSDRVRVLGPYHPDTLTARHSLAHWTGYAGNATGAISELNAVLADRIRILGPDHPHTLVTREKLAYWTGVIGKVSEASEALAVLLRDRLRVLGTEHPDTKSTENQLRSWRR